MEEEKTDIILPNEDEGISGKEPQRTLRISGMYENWFLDYASYVILERAVPDVKDGLKPVQRRILHAMKELDDGRYNKVANIIGHTMRYHPHGDASIGDALVQLGQKDLLIDAQGNWGNILTGDSAAASRYIEARLSKFALEVIFNPKTTNWKLSYDGRNQEPVTLPVKFPLLAAQGVEGIAVGLASKILPHNFNELIDACIAILGGDDFEVYPDFPTGGLIDVSKYNDGIRGGKVRVRAKIKKLDNKTLAITEIPFGITTTSLIDTIILANDKRKIKIRKIDDNTASEAEIIIHLMPGVSPDQTIDALYAFTSCEVSISPNGCVIQDGKPRFLDVKEMVRISTQNTLDLLRLELEIKRSELQESWHQASLEKIFIEERIYRKIETCTTWESVIKTIDKGLEPFKPQLLREVSEEDIVRLTEIKIKRISKFNSFKADDVIKSIEAELIVTGRYLDNLVAYSIDYFRQIQKKYGKGKERKTEIRNFDTIEAAKVAVANQKLYINREEGFAGTSLKKDEYVCDCSDIDDIIIFKEDGTFRVIKVEAKLFVGKDVVHINVFKKNDERTIYNLIYRDGKKGVYYAKRFAVVGITRDKEYNLTKGSADSKIIYFSANPNGEAETVKVFLRPKPRMKKTSFEFEFSSLTIKGRSSHGNILTRQPVRQVQKKEEGVSTLGAREIWYDETVKRLNTENRGVHLGAFQGTDRIFTITASGHYKLFGQDLSTHFDDDMIMIEKFNPRRIISAVYIDGNTRNYYVKRFPIEVTDKKVNFLNEHADTKLVLITLDRLPVLEVVFAEKKGKRRDNEIIQVAEFIGDKSYKAKGRRLSDHEIEVVRWLEPLPFDEPVEMFEVVAVGEAAAETEHVSGNEEVPEAGVDKVIEDKQGDGQPTEEPPGKKKDDLGIQIRLEFE
jgi:topoisomerase-4 subunit A